MDGAHTKKLENVKNHYQILESMLFHFLSLIGSELFWK